MSSCLTCDELFVVAVSGDRVVAQCKRFPERRSETGLCWVDLAAVFRVACEHHLRRCAQCGALLEGVAESRASFCPGCRKQKRKVDIGLAPVEIMHMACVSVYARAGDLS